jgi:hypothetical protein
MNRREFLALSVGVGSIAGQLTYGQENLDPLKTQPDTHKLLFENKFVRVIESSVPPGHTELKHSHPHSVTVHLVDSDAEVTRLPDGRTTRIHSVGATADWNEAVVHEVKNVGQTTFHAIRVELKC